MPVQGSGHLLDLERASLVAINRLSNRVLSVQTSVRLLDTA